MKNRIEELQARLSEIQIELDSLNEEIAKSPQRSKRKWAKQLADAAESLNTALFHIDRALDVL